MVNRTANAFGMELAIQSVNQLAQTTEVTVSEKVTLALLAGSDVALDTKKVVLDGAWRIVSPIHLAYLSAKFAQPTDLVVVSQQDILGNLVPRKTGIPILIPVLEQADTLARISNCVEQNEAFASLFKIVIFPVKVEPLAWW